MTKPLEAIQLSLFRKLQGILVAFFFFSFFFFWLFLLCFERERERGVFHWFSPHMPAMTWSGPHGNQDAHLLRRSAGLLSPPHGVCTSRNHSWQPTQMFQASYPESSLSASRLFLIQSPFSGKHCCSLCQVHLRVYSNDTMTTTCQLPSVRQYKYFPLSPDNGKSPVAKPRAYF